MVPKDASGDGGKDGAGRGRKAKSARSRSAEKTKLQPPEAIDPDVAVVIKDPLRVHIVSQAFQRLISPSEFAKEFDCPLWKAAYNFSELEKHGFLEHVKSVPVRGSLKHMYRATKRAYISSQDWRLVAPTVQPGIAGAALRDLTNRVKDALELGTFCARADAYLLWTPLTLDEKAWKDFVGMMAWAYDEAKNLEVESIARESDEKSEGSFPATFILAGFESPTTKEVQAHAKKKEKEQQAKDVGRGKGKSESKRSPGSP